MATTSRVTPWGWEQGDDSADSSRVTPGGWEQVEGAGAPATTGALPLLGRGPGMALAGNGGGLAGNTGAAACGI